VFSLLFLREFGYHAPMAKSSISHVINAARFRLNRVEKDWDELAAILRQAAAEPGYCGPDLEVVERVEDDIAGVKSAADKWVLKM
jgi:hypothetical protein